MTTRSLQHRRSGVPRANEGGFRRCHQDRRNLSFQLDRWIDPAEFGWYSGDSHVHAAGCSHYQNPAEGVLPKDMMRQIQGEKLNIGAVLTWGPDYYYQKQFFSGHDDPLSQSKASDALRPGGFGIPIQPRRPPRFAGA